MRTPNTDIEAALGLDRTPSWRRHIAIAVLLVAAIAGGGGYGLLERRPAVARPM